MTSMKYATYINGQNKLNRLHNLFQYHMTKYDSKCFEYITYILIFRANPINVNKEFTVSTQILIFDCSGTVRYYS